MAANPIELKTVDSMPGSINELISTNKRLKRPPSLSESFAWTPENIERAYNNQLLNEVEREAANEADREVANEGRIEVRAAIQNAIINADPPLERSRCCSEKEVVATIVKLLFHITLISIFETVFFFLYVSTLENSGIESTVSTFINGATNSCKNLTQVEIQLVDDFLDPFINASEVIKSGNKEMAIRAQFNNKIMIQSWYYVIGLCIIFILTFIYIKVRKIQVMWKSVVMENMAMVLLLAIYEYMFFETIIYQFQPLTAAEIARNAVQKLQQVCGILEN